MASRQRKKPSFDAIRNKIGEAHFFLQHLKDHRDRQRDAVRPAAYEFSYYLSAFVSAVSTVSDLMKKITPEWWEQLNSVDRPVHDRFWEMRGATVHDGEVETNPRTEEVPVRFDPNHYLQGQRVQGFFFSSMFGEAYTHAVTHSIDVEGVEREVVELCEEYLALLKREIEALEESSCQAQP